MRFLPALLVGVFLGCHASLGWILYKERPHLDVLPPQPTDWAVQALSFGDLQFFYRAFVLQIQNAGDTGGRFTPMKDYDIPAVVAWLGVLQRLDPLSSHYTALAVRYFSQITNPEDLRRLISFVDRDVEGAPDRKWYWQTQAVAMARDKLKDTEYALEISKKIAGYAAYVPEGYFWALQMEPVLLEDLGRKDEAFAVMTKIVKTHGERMNVYERTWTQQFFDRLNK